MSYWGKEKSPCWFAKVCNKFDWWVHILKNTDVNMGNVDRGGCTSMVKCSKFNTLRLGQNVRHFADNIFITLQNGVILWSVWSRMGTDTHVMVNFFLLIILLNHHDDIHSSHVHVNDTNIIAAHTYSVAVFYDWKFQGIVYLSPQHDFRH